MSYCYLQGLFHTLGMGQAQARAAIERDQVKGPGVKRKTAAIERDQVKGSGVKKRKTA